MKAENKKLLLYAGGTLILGSVAFFVYSFFKKPKDVFVAQDGVVVKDQQTTKTTTSTNPFSSTNVDFGSIKAPDIIADLQRTFSSSHKTA